jgi:hypothetical protein
LKTPKPGEVVRGARVLGGATALQVEHVGPDLAEAAAQLVAKALATWLETWETETTADAIVVELLERKEKALAAL